MRDEESQHCGAKREVDQIPGKPVGNFLDRRAGVFWAFYRLDDLAESGVLAQACRPNLKGTGLVHRARIDLTAG